MFSVVLWICTLRTAELWLLFPSATTVVLFPEKTRCDYCFTHLQLCYKFDILQLRILHSQNAASGTRVSNQLPLPSENWELRQSSSLLHVQKKEVCHLLPHYLSLFFQLSGWIWFVAVQPLQLLRSNHFWLAHKALSTMHLPLFVPRHNQGYLELWLLFIQKRDNSSCKTRSQSVWDSALKVNIF